MELIREANCKNPRRPLLSVRELTLEYRTSRGPVRAVDRVSFDIGSREALAVLGETGCGKTSLTRALLRTLPGNVSELSGKAYLKGREIISMDENVFRKEVRWTQISLVMQAAMNALNPVIKVGEQVAEPLRLRLRWPRGKAMEKAAEAFGMVGLPADFLNRYPFELSGGMKQRAVIAMALVTEPSVIILDEPTSALDVLSQGNIFNVLKRVKHEHGTSFIFITHDVAASSELADRVAVMYAGQIVELSRAEDFFNEPAHPYAKLLLGSVPRLRGKKERGFTKNAPAETPATGPGCRFAARCPERAPRCEETAPRLLETPGGRLVRCRLFGKNTGTGC